MRRALLAVVVFVATSVGVVDLPPALACSCTALTGPVVEFTGEAVEASRGVGFDTEWTFRVMAAVRGTESGDVVSVSIASQDGSCSVGEHPTTGRIYGVGARQASDADGSTRLSADTCGGYVRELRPAAPPTRDLVAGPAIARQAHGLPTAIAVAAFFIVAAATASKSLRTQRQRGAATSGQGMS